MKAYEHIVDEETGEETLREIEVTVTVEAPEAPTTEERVTELEEAFELLLSGVTE